MQTRKKIKLIDFKLKKTLGNLLFSINKSNFFGNGLDFLKHKEYIFGDPVKNINWKIYSKTEKLHSKIFEEEKEINVLFVLDLSSDLTFSSSKIKKKDIFQEVFYTLALSSYKTQNNFSSLVFDGKTEDFFTYKKDFSNIYKTIEKIEEFSKNSFEKEKNIENIFDFLVKKNIRNNLIFILSDFIFEKENKNLKILGLKNELIYINIFDEIENNLSSKNRNFVFNSGKKVLDLNLFDENKIKIFNDLREKRLKNFRGILKKNKIGYIYIDSSKNSFIELKNYFTKI